MKNLCAQCFYFFYDEVTSDGKDSIIYRCGKPVKNMRSERIKVSGLYHDIITIKEKFTEEAEYDGDTVITPHWCEGFKRDVD